MFHDLTIGHLSQEDAAIGELVVLRPLSDLSQEKIRLWVQGHQDKKFQIGEEWIRVPLFSPWFCRASAELALELLRDEKCLVVDLRCCEIYTSKKLEHLLSLIWNNEP